VNVDAVTPQQENDTKQELYRVWGRGRRLKTDATVPPPPASSAGKLEMQRDLDSFTRQASDPQRSFGHDVGVIIFVNVVQQEYSKAHNDKHL
jgi:hypothetical protein